MNLKRPGTQIVGYSTSESVNNKENIMKNLDGFISKPAFNIEEFYTKLSLLVNK